MFHSSDVDEAREQVARIFCPHRLDPVTGGIDARHHSVRLNETVSLNFVDYHGDVRIVPGELETFTVVQAPLSGKAVIRNGAREIVSEPGLASVPRPDEPLSMRWTPDCAQLIVQLDQRALERDLAAILGRPLHGPIRWQLGLDTNRGSSGMWWRQVRFLVDEIDHHPELLEYPLAVEQHERWLRTGLLVAHHHDYSTLLARPELPSGPRAVHQAIELMESYPELALTVTSMAGGLGVSARSLQRAFRRHLDTTPRAYLHEVRLRRVREELLTAVPGSGLTVTDAAWRWGFTHLGRFSARYRQRYGEPPSRTLRRGREVESNQPAGPSERR